MYKQRSHYRPNRRRYGSSSPRSNGQGFRGRKTPDFNPMMFVRKASEVENETFEPNHNFCDFDINQQLARNIEKKGYGKPTPIQDMAIQPLLDGKDVVGIANTGTGKTAAFLIPLINKMLNDRQEQVLIVAPTRELALQIDQEFRGLTLGLGLQSVVCIGGVGIGAQIQGLRRGARLTVGTPGRLKDLEDQRKLNFGNYRTIVLDEVDRMLDMGFIRDITYIISKLPRKRQSLFFSATLPESVKGVMEDFLMEPVMITIKKQPTSENVDQDIVRLNGRDKITVLDELLSERDFEKVLVFGRTKRGIDKVARELSRRNVSVATIHGNKTQGQRQRALDEFKNNRVQVLLATDIASRGIDVNNITHVINYDLPETYEDYIHRIGRTGRANKKGKSLTFVD